MPSDDIARLYDFMANTDIVSDQVDAELNQLVNTCNGKAGRAIDNTFSGANSFSGSNTFSHATAPIKTDIIAERTSATGVTIDGALLKDGMITVAGIAAADGQIGYDSNVLQAYINGGLKTIATTDYAFLPTQTGNSGKFLTTNGSAASWAKVMSVAVLQDQKSSGTNGGTFTQGDWRTRDLNTEVDDPDGIVSISSNQFTLAAGTYIIRASAPGFAVNSHQIRLQNITDTSTVVYGSTEYAPAATGVTSRSTLSKVVTISGSKAFEIQHRGANTRSTDGYGQAGSFGNVEVYAIVEIVKVG